jgi:hypothetical protein
MKAPGLFLFLLACSAVGVANPDADNEPAGEPSKARRLAGEGLAQEADARPGPVDLIPIPPELPADGPPVATVDARADLIPTLPETCDPVTNIGSRCPSDRWCAVMGPDYPADACASTRECVALAGRRFFCRRPADCPATAPRCAGATCDPAIKVCER